MFGGNKKRTFPVIIPTIILIKHVWILKGMYQIPVDAHIKDTCLLISQLTCLLQTSHGLHKAGGMQNSQEDLLLLISHWKMQSSSCQHLPAYYLSLKDGSMGRVKNWCSETMNSLHPVCGWPWVKVITEHWPCLAHRGRLQWTNDGDQALKTAYSARQKCVLSP